jgi:RNA polymerase sigma-70 factor (ECF subfamily)
VVLDAFAPAEQVAFVLHDVFAVPFEDIAPIVGRSPAAARQFLAAARGGDFEGLLAVLDPDVVLRSVMRPLVRGAAAVARQALLFSQAAGCVTSVLVNGAAGILWRTLDGRLFSVMSFTWRAAGSSKSTSWPIPRASVALGLAV